ncbi:MAG: hypothetical protein KDK97_12390 [Verrucomicrobiales bacterium]|nr:hypothetical protein [Verrucomicrobiales bacterium]
MNSILRISQTALLLCGSALTLTSARADEHLFGRTLGAETLPSGTAELNHFLTLRSGKDSGSYLGWDLDMEYEYGITDRLTLGIDAIHHHFSVRDNAELGDIEGYKFGGIEATAKYRVLTPFKDPVGLAFRLETGYLWTDDVGGFSQEEILISPEILLQKNFLDDTLILALNLGAEWAWGKQPAEEYNKEVSFDGRMGVSYRVAPNWFIGAEGRIRSEYPLFDLSFHEHTVVFVGPALHYGSEKWWATLSWGYQVWGRGVDEPRGNSYAEEAQNEFRLKIGFNF